ncbi:hypothetical protein [Propionicimonas sp.]|uniref:hypothetical protein n=1 Tax=Propionicimonas sp. TaxID=1955623 RepID=UPI0017EC678B|nr:hypothetical protein [Propionicimonas sp.]MBU3977791.1 hypothetical protein [Actinomycetota bacterium]MBA3021714.1 hypothetical protein [Propionicimonas sp.]MBU3987265.1 hypothetical protein [Actinomycetota bacterium]MBU4009086.1 hypothetical protein [Actinomycetota bacterium]MBU4065764.1 hypothetical protein [Actinomycetota bacterium]
MSSEHPWRNYDKDRLPRGLAHVVGRDQIESALEVAGVTLGSLSLGKPAADPRTAPIVVFDVYWVGDGRSRYVTVPSRDETDRLLMRWQAVPSELRQQLSVEIIDRWLPEACSWAAAASTRGNVWKSVDQRWMLKLSAGLLSSEIATY